jgi:hypothetical protein
MTAKGNELELDIRSSLEADLVVDRTDISFEDLDGETVRIRVRVRNEGGRASKPTLMRLESAPFGAFVPWRPFAVLPVPPIEPGASGEVRIDGRRRPRAPLGNFGLIPPRTLLTAVSSPDELPPDQRGSGVNPGSLRRPGAAGLRISRFQPPRRFLAADLWECVGSVQPHWAGNINVFVGARAVERHLARALRVYAGRPNLAAFFVGSPGKPDAYSFAFVGREPDWEASLHDATRTGTLPAAASGKPIEELRWVEATQGQMLIVMKLHPPAGCQVGNVEVHVRRQSSGEKAIVEFNLDPAAKGAGCYFA